MEVVISDDQVEDVITTIMQAAQTGRIGDGKIFVIDLQEAVRIRTGERGEDAVWSWAHIKYKLNYLG